MITDAQVNAALAAHYPGEWPDDPIFHKPIEAITKGPYVGTPWRIQLMDEMRRVLAAALAVAWQPMTTAPKDGGAFLARNGNWYTVCHWHRHQQCWASNGPVYSAYPADEQPLEWMPLPTNLVANLDNQAPFKEGDTVRIKRNDHLGLHRVESCEWFVPRPGGAQPYWLCECSAISEPIDWSKVPAGMGIVAHSSWRGSADNLVKSDGDAA